jgi:hypothetical protein
MKFHDLKSRPAEFEAVDAGLKDFEIRRDDRGFSGGDIVVLREYRPGLGYSGQVIGPFQIGYVERSECLPEGWCGFRIHSLVRK